MTIRLLNQKIFEGNTKVLDDIIHVCIGGKWYKAFAGTRVRDIKYTDEGMEFTSDYVSEYDPSRHWGGRFIFEGNRKQFVVSRYNSPPFKDGGVLIDLDEVLNGKYINTKLYYLSQTKRTDEELNRKIVWLEPNFEVVKENKNESSN